MTSTIHRGGIRRKLLRSFLIVLLAFSIVAGIMAATVLQGILSREILSLSRKSLADVKDKLQLIADHVLAVSNIYFINPDVYRFLASDALPNTYEWHRERIVMEDMYRLYDFAFDWLDYDIMVTDHDGNHFQTFTVDDIHPAGDPDSWVTQAWYRTARENDGRVAWIPGWELDGVPGLSGHDRLFAVRQLRNDFTGRDAGMLLIGVDISSLDDRLYGGLDPSHGTVLIITEQGRLVSASTDGYDQLTYESSVPAAVREAVLGTAGGAQRVRIDRRPSVVIWDDVFVDGWRLVSLVPQENVFSSVYLSRRFLLVTIAICFAVAAALANAVARSLSRPILTLAAEMEAVKAGDLSVVSNVKTNDEIGGLAIQFNSLVARTGDLIKSVSRNWKRRQRAELRALQLQINPHFLYNTLGTIRFMLRVEARENVERMLISLTRITRHIFSGGFAPVPVRQELALLNEYVSLVQAQLSRPVSLECNVPDEVQACVIPRMILQPLVENSVFHGIKPMDRPGIIRIEGAIDGGSVLLSVTDNGVGSEITSLSVLERRAASDLDQTLHAGIGLLNIRDRLKVRFGGAARLSVDSDASSWTTVTVQFPATDDPEQFDLIADPEEVDTP